MSHDKGIKGKKVESKDICHVHPHMHTHKHFYNKIMKKVLMKITVLFL